MKATIESTDRVIDIVTAGGSVPARIWQGTTDGGIAIQMMVTRIAVKSADDTAAFDRELHATPAVRPSEPQAFPARLVL